MFRSQAQLAMLGEVFCGTRPYTISELAAAAHTTLATASREVAILSDCGVVTVESGPGRAKLVSPHPDLAYGPDLRRILAHTYGLLPLLRAMLDNENRVEQAWIFGSWARPYHGERGHFPRDIDIVIVTERSGFDLLLPWHDIDGELRIEINPVHSHLTRSASTTRCGLTPEWCRRNEPDPGVAAQPRARFRPGAFQPAMRDRLLRSARSSLRGAEALLETAPTEATVLAENAARMAIIALAANDGVRIDSPSKHIAAITYARSRPHAFDGPTQTGGLEFLRRARNQAMYGDERAEWPAPVDVSAQDAQGAVRLASRSSVVSTP